MGLLVAMTYRLAVLLPLLGPHSFADGHLAFGRRLSLHERITGGRRPGLAGLFLAALVGWPAGPAKWRMRRGASGGSTVFWVIGYDTTTRFQDKEDDALVGVKSSALALGRHARLGIFICYLAALGLWAAAIQAARIEWFALLGLVPMALHLLWQVAALKPDDGADALAKFRSNRFAGLLMFACCYVVGTASCFCASSL